MSELQAVVNRQANVIATVLGIRDTHAKPALATYGYLERLANRGYSASPEEGAKQLERNIGALEDLVTLKTIKKELSQRSKDEQENLKKRLAYVVRSLRNWSRTAGDIDSGDTGSEKKYRLDKAIRILPEKLRDRSDSLLDANGSEAVEAYADVMGGNRTSHAQGTRLANIVINIPQLDYNGKAGNIPWGELAEKSAPVSQAWSDISQGETVERDVTVDNHLQEYLGHYQEFLLDGKSRAPSPWVDLTARIRDLLSNPSAVPEIRRQAPVRKHALESVGRREAVGHYLFLGATSEHAIATAYRELKKKTRKYEAELEASSEEDEQDIRKELEVLAYREKALDEEQEAVADWLEALHPRRLLSTYPVFGNWMVEGADWRVDNSLLQVQRFGLPPKETHHDRYILGTAYDTSQYTSTFN